VVLKCFNDKLGTAAVARFRALTQTDPRTHLKNGMLAFHFL
jgi:hypothetical protein